MANQLRTVPPLAPYSDAIGLGIVVLGITYLTLIFGELAPKRLALHSPERIAASVAAPMRALSTLAGPVVGLLGGSTDLVLRLLGARLAEEVPVTQEEIAVLIEQGQQAGVFEAAEQEIVESVFRLAERRVGSLMTPRPDIVWLDADDSPEQLRQVVVESSHARFPICRGALDDVIGIVAAKDVLAQAVPGESLDLAAMVSPPLLVPESMPALRLLEQFKQRGIHVALVMDEYGGLQGLVTSTDILEALVGDIPTPEELAEPPVLRREDGSWLIDGMLPVEELKELLNVGELPEERAGDYHTVAGLTLKVLGRVPTAGDHFAWSGHRFEVVDMDGNRIDKVLVSSTPPNGPGE